MPLCTQYVHKINFCTGPNLIPIRGISDFIIFVNKLRNQIAETFPLWFAVCLFNFSISSVSTIVRSLYWCVCVFVFSIRFWFVQVSSLQFDCHSNGRPENDIFINISKRFFSFFLFLFHLFLSVSVLLCTIFVRCVFVPSFAVIPILFHSATVGHVSKYYGRQKTMLSDECQIYQIR